MGQFHPEYRFSAIRVSSVTHTKLILNYDERVKVKQDSEENEQRIHLSGGIGGKSFRLTSEVLKNLQKCRLPEFCAIL